MSDMVVVLRKVAQDSTRLRTMSRETMESRLETLLVTTSRTFALSIPELPQPTRGEVTVMTVNRCPMP